MRIDQITVTTRQAADLTGWDYEAFRARLKDGMLKATGAIPSSAGETDAKRWTWSRFGLRDLCSFRLIRCLMDAGVSFADANAIASDNELWRCWRGADDFMPVESWTPTLIVYWRALDGRAEWSTAHDFAPLWGKSDHALIFVPAHLIRWRIGQALIEIAGDEYGA